MGTTMTPPPNGYALEAHAMLMLGRVLEAKENVIVRLDRIDRRLEHGDGRMQEMSTQLGDLSTRITSIEGKVEAASERREPPEDQVGRIEKLSKAWLAVIVPLLVAWATGSIEAGLKMAGLFK